MEFKCGCSMKQRVVGDGCQLCNTDLAIDLVEQPEELMDTLVVEYGLTDSEAHAIAFRVYSPLMSLISTLNEKIEQLRRVSGEKRTNGCGQSINESEGYNISEIFKGF